MSDPAGHSGSPTAASIAAERTRIRSRSSVLSAGEPMIWLTGGSLMLCLVMVVLLLGYIFKQGMMTFWPGPVTHIVTEDGRQYLGEIAREEEFDFTATAAWSMWTALEQRIQATADEKAKAELTAQRDTLLAKTVELLSPELDPALADLENDGAVDAFRIASSSIDAVHRSLSALELPSEAQPRQVRDNLTKLLALQTLFNRSPDQVDLDGAIGRLENAQQHLAAVQKSVELMFYIGGDRDFARVRHSRTAVKQLRDRLAAVQQVLQDRRARPEVRKALQQAGDRFLHVLNDLAGSTDPGVAHTAQNLRDAVRVRHRRRLLRTGNYRLSKTHFDWVADFEIATSAAPPWAMVVERREWGRFYGFPQSFTQKTRRPPSDEEHQLQSVQTFLARHGRLLKNEDARAIEAAKKQVQEKLQAVRSHRSQDFLAKVKSDDAPVQRALLEGGQAVPFDRVGADQNVIGALRISEGRAQAWEQWTRHHPVVQTLFDREYVLRRSEIGRVNHDQEQSRLSVRQLELDTDVNLLETAMQVLTLQEQINALDRQMEQAAQAVEYARTHFQADAKTASLASRLLVRFRQANAGNRNDRVRQIGQLEAELKARLGDEAEDGMTVLQSFWRTQQRTAEQTREINEQIEALDRQQARYEIEMEAIGNGPNRNRATKTTLALADIVRAYPANRFSRGEKWNVYVARWGEFLADDPREANSEGGVFPAIVGTVVMTLILAMVVVPFGALAALYLREYAKAGPIVSVIRIAINNLAGVPSIVFGVFGMIFFCYMVGSFIDGGPRAASIPVLPKMWWFGILIGAAVAELLGVIAAYANRGGGKHDNQSTPWLLNAALAVPLMAVWIAAAGIWLRWIAGAESVVGVAVPLMVLGMAGVFFWMLYSSTFCEKNDPRSFFSRLVYMVGLATAIATVAVVIFLVATTPFFDGFYEARLVDGNPTFGKGALIWASLTLALLTLPVVIVATEEALSAVPNSMREGSYACGASKWQTIQRIVLPRAMPGIMTGMILAMARGAGEVAPLMLVGAVKLAPKLPVSWNPPFGVDRSFMHLGFHIYDVGFQSPNSEAAKPMVFTTTFLLIGIVAVLNVTAIALRTRLRRKFVASQF